MLQWNGGLKINVIPKIVNNWKESKRDAVKIACPKRIKGKGYLEK